MSGRLCKNSAATENRKYDDLSATWCQRFLRSCGSSYHDHRHTSSPTWRTLLHTQFASGNKPSKRKARLFWSNAAMGILEKRYPHSPKHSGRYSIKTNKQTKQKTKTMKKQQTNKKQKQKKDDQQTKSFMHRNTSTQRAYDCYQPPRLFSTAIVEILPSLFRLECLCKIWNT